MTASASPMTPKNTRNLATHPDSAASAVDWVGWFWSGFFPAWIERATDPEGFGYFDVLDMDGTPKTDRKSVLTHARLLFTFSHLALRTGNPAYFDAAKIARDTLPVFRKPTGLYLRGLARDGRPNTDTADGLATSYDQSFVILGLSTWGKLELSEDTDAELEACWAAIESQLIDATTGLLLEHDDLADPAAPDAPPRAQNPHMHLYEAALQAFEMTGKPIWLDRAKTMRAKGLEFFFDTDSGTITEFIAPDLTVLPGREGSRREVGHQCEWAWLLMREVELGGDADMQSVASRLLAFADAHGFANDGVMKGAAFDAVSADASWREDRFLLWPQTEAVKACAIRSEKAADAQSLMLLIFQRYFAGRSAFVNQVDGQGDVVWPDALSRLHYHLVLGLTEGARAGLWQNPS